MKNITKMILLAILPFSLLGQSVTSNLEYLKISNVGSGWTNIILSNSYTEAIVVCTSELPSSVNSPNIVRINYNGVTPITNSFQIRIQSPLNSAPGYTSNVYCIISDEGSYTVPFKYEAHKVVSTITSRRALGAETVENVTASLSNAYSNPVVLGQVMSYLDVKYSVFWSHRCGSRNIPFNGSTTLCVGKHISYTSTNITRANEVLGYIVAESGKYLYNNIRMKVALGSDSIGGVGSSPPYEYYLEKYYSHVVATQAAEDGGDGGWAVFYGNNPLSGGRLKLAIEEAYTGRGHTTEEVGYWAFVPTVVTSANMKINEILYRQNTNGINNNEFIEFYVTSSGTLLNYVFTDQDGSSHHYHFPNTNVSVGDYVILHIGEGTDNSSGNVHHFYMNSTEVLNNGEDDIVLLKPSNTDTTTVDGVVMNAIPYDYVSYGSGSGIDSIPTSTGGVTLNWNTAHNNQLDGASKGESISLTPNATDSDTSNCWEQTATTVASEKASSCTNYMPTRDTNTGASQINSITASNTVNAIMKIRKFSCVIADGINSNVNAKRIPGATIRYALEVANTGSGAADNVLVDDTLKPQFDTSTIENLQIVAGACDCLGVTSASNNPSPGTGNGIHPIKLNFGTVLGGSVATPTKECGYFEVEIS